MRSINEYVSQFYCGRYFFLWEGDELLMKASSDEEAVKEGNELLKELDESAQG